MKKQDAIDMFGTPTELAKALGITRQAVYQWPDEISQEQEDRVIGAAYRLGVSLPSQENSGEAA